MRHVLRLRLAVAGGARAFSAYLRYLQSQIRPDTVDLPSGSAAFTDLVFHALHGARFLLGGLKTSRARGGRTAKGEAQLGFCNLELADRHRRAGLVVGGIECGRLVEGAHRERFVCLRSYPG